MWLYNLYIPSLHDELGHPRISIGMPTLTTLSCQLWSSVVPMLEAQLFQYRICIDMIILTMYTSPTKFTWKETYIVFFPVLSVCMYPFRYYYIYMGLFGIFSVLFSLFRCLLGPFRSFSVFIATNQVFIYSTDNHCLNIQKQQTTCLRISETVLMGATMFKDTKSAISLASVYVSPTKPALAGV